MKYSTGIEMKELPLHPTIGMNLTIIILGGVRYKNASTGNFINVKFYKIVKAKYSVRRQERGFL